MPPLKPYPLTSQHIKWAYVLPGSPGYKNSLELFRRVCTMLISEIMRNDEVAVVFFEEEPISVMKLMSPESYENGPFSASFPYEGLSWKPALKHVKRLLSTEGMAIGTTALNVLFYRPQTHESFNISERFENYHSAWRHADRREKIVIAHMLTVDTDLDASTSVCAAQINSKSATDFFDNLAQVSRSDNQGILKQMLLKVIDAVDGWTQGVYCEDLEIAHCQEKTNYPIAPMPVEFIDADKKLDFYVLEDRVVLKGSAAT